MADLDLLAQAAGWHRVVHTPPLDLGDGHVDSPGLHVGGVEAPAGQGRKHRGLDGEPVSRDLSHTAMKPAVDRASIQRAARSLSSARLVGAPVAAHSSKNRSFTSRKGRSTLPFLLASLA